MKKQTCSASLPSAEEPKSTKVKLRDLLDPAARAWDDELLAVLPAIRADLAERERAARMAALEAEVAAEAVLDSLSSPIDAERGECRGR